MNNMIDKHLDLILKGQIQIIVSHHMFDLHVIGSMTNHCIEFQNSVQPCNPHLFVKSLDEVHIVWLD